MKTISNQVENRPMNPSIPLIIKRVLIALSSLDRALKKARDNVDNPIKKYHNPSIDVKKEWKLGTTNRLNPVNSLLRILCLTTVN